MRHPVLSSLDGQIRAESRLANLYHVAGLAVDYDKFPGFRIAATDSGAVAAPSHSNPSQLR